MKTKISDAEIQRPVKLSCRKLWKVFGPNAAKFMVERDGKASTVELDGAGLVGAVRNTTLDVREGEIFIVMGLSGFRQVDAGALPVAPDRTHHWRA